MQGVRQWAGQLMLRAPAPLRSLRDAPFIGALIHRWSHKVLPADEKVWAQVKSGPAKGLWLRLNPRTGQDYLLGRGELASQQILVERLRPGHVFYDLGANIGLFSLLAARLVAPTGKVFSFEPDFAVSERLKEHFERNLSHLVSTGDARLLSIVNAGVWSFSGELDFIPAGGSSPDRGTGSFLACAKNPRKSASEAPGVPVPCVSLDDFARSAPPPHGIKCDVEGAEVEVLRGALRMLKLHRPWILCETHSPESSLGAPELLTPLGYSVQAVDGNHFLALP